MGLSKDSIISRHFSKKILGGLDEFEVRDFLHVLAEEIRHLNQLAKNQDEKLAEQQGVIQDYKDREHILKSSIASAQSVANMIKKEASEKGQLIVDKAQCQSESLIGNARHSLQTVYNDIADLKRLHLQFKTGLKASLQAQLELVEQTPLFSGQLFQNETSFLEDQSSEIDKLDSQNENHVKNQDHSFIQNFESNQDQDQNPEPNQDHNQENSRPNKTRESNSQTENNFKAESSQQDLLKTRHSPISTQDSLNSLKQSLESLDKDFS